MFEPPYAPHQTYAPNLKAIREETIRVSELQDEDAKTILVHFLQQATRMSQRNASSTSSHSCSPPKRFNTALCAALVEPNCDCSYLPLRGKMQHILNRPLNQNEKKRLSHILVSAGSNVGRFADSERLAARVRAQLAWGCTVFNWTARSVRHTKHMYS